MIRLSLAQTADILGLTSSFPATEFTGISIDTRTLVPGNLFVALPGLQVDGNDFIHDAAKKGAAAALVSRMTDAALPQILVKDTVDALGKLSAAWRKQFQLPIIAVTGSNGKTTLKNMIQAILVAACQGNESEVLATQGTLNNHLGLPLTLARLNAQHRYAVIEMGMNHFGEIEYLTQLTKPSVAVITNAASCHIEGVGDVAGVARAKAEIFSGLSKDGIAVLNRDDSFYTYWRELVGSRRVTTFGFHPEAEITAVIQEGTHAQHINLRTPAGGIDIHLPLLGKHNAHNTLAAAAATLAIGIDLASIKRGLEAIKPAPGRLQLHTLSNGVKLIDDTYNANPFSLEAAIHTLASFSGKKILVLGDMKELGPDAKSIHAEAGKSIRNAGIDYLFTYGELSANTSQAFGEGAYHFNEQEKLVNALKPLLYNTTTILIKGSRSMRMEKVIAGLVQHGN